ncbi:putative alpha/beta hydrolase fold protein (plasmid) [Rhizobium tropici CIAT 899]|nr:putative alpha/beta hydrolase fold protein [Rhizobium tropici CIAT 899]
MAVPCGLAYLSHRILPRRAPPRMLFLSNTVRLHRLSRSAGVVVDLHVFEAMPHGRFMGGVPGDNELLLETKLLCRNISIATVARHARLW